MISDSQKNPEILTESKRCHIPLPWTKGVVMSLLLVMFYEFTKWAYKQPEPCASTPYASELDENTGSSQSQWHNGCLDDKKMVGLLHTSIRKCIASCKDITWSHGSICVGLELIWEDFVLDRVLVWIYQVYAGNTRYYWLPGKSRHEIVVSANCGPNVFFFIKKLMTYVHSIPS